MINKTVSFTIAEELKLNTGLSKRKLVILGHRARALPAILNKILIIEKIVVLKQNN